MVPLASDQGITGMRLSKRILNITPGGEDGWAVFYKARQMKADGQDVLELTIGDHDQKTDPLILEAMEKSARAGNTGYAMVPGSRALRDTVAARVQTRTGAATDYDNILITTGGQAALFAAHMAVLDPGDRALFLDPYYVTYPGTLRATGAAAHAVRTQPAQDFQPSRKDLDRAPAAKSLLINSPNNPTGVVYSPETMDVISDFAKERDLWLISDEVYDTQIWHGTHISPRALDGMEERTITIGSMSKSHAMTGSRIGWVVAPKEVVSCLIELSTSTTYGVPGYIQDAALFALQAGEVLEQSVASVFARRRNLAQKILKTAQSVSLIPPSGAMYLMLDVRATGLSGEAFALALLERKKIAVMPGESFGAAAAGHIRVAMTVQDDLFADALREIIGFADALARP